MNNTNPTIYLAIDDSGQLSKRDNIMTFGGLALTNKEQFNKEYQNIVDKTNKGRKTKKELKYNNLSNCYLHNFLDYLEKYFTFAIIIDNNKVYPNIMKNSKSKGRYLDYAIKILIKNVIKELINKKIINPNIDLELIIYIDESNYKSNGYYILENSIYEELKYGMSNIRNNISFKNIINSNLKVTVKHKNSYYNFLVQAADIIAGYTRVHYLNPIKINYIIHIPKKC